MSLDVYWRSPEAVTVRCECDTCGNEHTFERREELAWRNITHNLSGMFREAGVYELLWHGDGKRAGDLIPALKTAERVMKADPARFKKFDAENGWGVYEHALKFLADHIHNCETYPDAILECSR